MGTANCVIGGNNPAPTAVPVHPLIRNRWSPRAFSAEPIAREHLEAMVEAARWAPSSMNEQPWALIVADRYEDPEGYEALLSVLMPANRSWAQAAPVLILAVARTDYSRTGQPNRHAFYDTGQAIAQLVLQATEFGLSVHQMGGFDAAKAVQLLDIPGGYVPVVVLAAGYAGDPDDLDEVLRRRESAPRVRRPASEWVFGSRWGESW